MLVVVDMRMSPASAQAPPAMPSANPSMAPNKNDFIPCLQFAEQIPGGIKNSGYVIYYISTQFFIIGYCHIGENRLFFA